MAKDNGLRIESTKGTFKFCAVVGEGVENDNNPGNYEYLATLEVDLDSPIINEIDKYIDETEINGKEPSKVPYQTTEDYEKIPEGKAWLYSKTSTKWEDRDGNINDRNINIYNTRGKKIQLPEGTGIGSGTEGKILGNMKQWTRGKAAKLEYGYTIWLTGVQITNNFVPYEFDNAPAAEEDGGFEGFDIPGSTEVDEEEETPTRRSRRSRRG